MIYGSYYYADIIMVMVIIVIKIRLVMIVILWFDDINDGCDDAVTIIVVWG